MRTSHLLLYTLWGYRDTFQSRIGCPLSILSSHLASVYQFLIDQVKHTRRSWQKRNAIKRGRSLLCTYTFTSKDVIVWRASLSPPVFASAHLQRVLAQEEIPSAARFHLKKDRNRWMAL